MDAIDLLPVGSDLVQIIRKSEHVKDLDDAIVKNLDVIVLCAMNILFQVFNGLKDSPYGDAGRQAVGSISTGFPSFGALIYPFAMMAENGRDQDEGASDHNVRRNVTIPLIARYLFAIEPTPSLSSLA